jgi:hypothetical protein
VKQADATANAANVVTATAVVGLAFVTGGLEKHCMKFRLPVIFCSTVTLFSGGGIMSFSFGH